MATTEKITTLFLKEDPSTLIYPNIKAANIPDGSISSSKLVDTIPTITESNGIITITI